MSKLILGCISHLTQEDWHPLTFSKKCEWTPFKAKPCGHIRKWLVIPSQALGGVLDVRQRKSTSVEYLPSLNLNSVMLVLFLKTGFIILVG